MAATEQLTPRIYLKIDGSDASEEVMDNVISIEVDDSLTLPDMFAIHLKDPNLKWIDADSFSLGKSVEISAKNGRAETKLILGEITGIEPHLNPATGPTLILRGYDKSHRLNRGKKTSSFVQMTDGDIAKKIAQNAGLKSKVDPTRQVHEYVLQENQTDWEFLISRAQRIGYHVLVKDGVLHFVKAPDGGGQAPILEWAVDLSQFNARLSTIHQVSEVVVQGWDPDRQQQIVGRATQARDIPQIGESRQGGEAAKDAFGVEAKEIIVNRPVATQAEADALAQSICDEIGQGFIEAECVCFGNPAVQAGAMVELQGLGDRFSGNYRITHALHRYDASGYTTEFTIGGRHATTIAELLSSRNGSNGSHSPVLGVVTNNNDPKDLGRVKVKIPSLKDGEESGWARLVAPGAGKKRGFQWLPEVGDEVLVIFEHEDIHKPLVVGGLWSEKNSPSMPSGECLNSQGEVTLRGLVSRTGMKLSMSDDAGDKWITIANSGDDIAVKVSDTGSVVEIVSKGEIKIKATGKVSVEGQDVELKANNSMKMQASGIVEVKGAQIKLN